MTGGWVLAGVWVLAFCAAPARALERAPLFEVTGAFVSGSPSALGAKVGTSLLLGPLEDHEFLLGPVLAVSDLNGDLSHRVDFLPGLQGQLWILNAIGPGLSASFVASTESVGATRFQFEPFLAARFKRLSRTSALALRGGVPYDTFYKWGVDLGFSLQFAGVPNVGESAE